MTRQSSAKFTGNRVWRKTLTLSGALQHRRFGRRVLVLRLNHPHLVGRRAADDPITRRLVVQQPGHVGAGIVAGRIGSRPGVRCDHEATGLDRVDAAGGGGDLVAQRVGTAAVQISRRLCAGVESADPDRWIDRAVDAIAQ